MTAGQTRDTRANFRVSPLSTTTLFSRLISAWGSVILCPSTLTPPWSISRRASLLDAARPASVRSRTIPIDPSRQGQRHLRQDSSGMSFFTKTRSNSASAARAAFRAVVHPDHLAGEPPLEVPRIHRLLGRAAVFDLREVRWPGRRWPGRSSPGSSCRGWTGSFRTSAAAAR